MSDDTVAADPYDGKTNPELKAELRARGLSAAGNKDVLLAALRDSDAAPEDLTKDKLVERAGQLGIENFPTGGSKQEMIDAINAADTAGDDFGTVEDEGATEENSAGDTEASAPNHLPEQADHTPPATSTRAGLIGEHLDANGQPLTQKFPEPADVAAPEASADEFSTRALAHAARDRADVEYREGDGSKDHMSMSDVDSTPGNSDFKVDEYPTEGFHEATLPVTDRREAQLAEWAERNPHATVIPPSLLPPAYQDPTIATPGLPGGPVVR